MSLFESWSEVAYNPKTQEEYKAFWDAYLPKETEIYKAILGKHQENLQGSVGALATQFDVDPKTFVGFLDGINESLSEKIVLEELSEESEITLHVDFEKLLFNMHDAKADWLYELDEWDDIFSKEKQEEIATAYKKSKTIVKEPKIGRNDPCPCGSGKKYKKCCGKESVFA